MELLRRVTRRIGSLADRAIATAAEGAIIGVGVDSMHADAFSLDWRVIIGSAFGGAFLSLAYNLSREGISGRLDPDLRRLDAPARWRDRDVPEFEADPGD